MATKKQKANKVGKVMREFKNKSLKSSSGKKVTSRAQALAIAISESNRIGKKGSASRRPARSRKGK